MIRRQPIETKINHERWLVSYADFVTLLFAFFVVMYSVSQVSESKYKELSDTLSEAFQGQDRNVSDNKAPDAQVQDQSVATQESPNESLADLSELQIELEQSLAGLVDKNVIALSGNEDWIEIDINANLIFESAKAELSSGADKIFRDIADILSPYENAVEVSGHTDNVPIRNSQFENNWELSSSRAVSVVNLLAFSGVQPQQLSAVGYGEYRPVADNTSDEGRANNRRVVLRVARGKAEQPTQKADELLNESGEIISNVDGDNSQLEQERESESGSQSELQSEPQSEQQPELEPAPVIQPIELDNGGLLFTSDPESPRNSR